MLQDSKTAFHKKAGDQERLTGLSRYPYRKAEAETRVEKFV
jgi:hypothetical protein